MPVHKPDIIYDRFKVHTLAGRAAAAIKNSGQRYDGLIPIANGGLAAGLLLSEITGLPIVDVMRLRRYADDAKQAMMQGARIIWGPEPENVTNRRLILVDDVLDEGYSIVRGKQLLYNEMNASVVHTAVLDFKLGPRAEHFQTLTPDYVGEVHQGAPWIEYPWEKEGTTHESELLMLVTLEHLKRENVDRIISLVREREAKAKAEANTAAA